MVVVPPAQPLVLNPIRRGKLFLKYINIYFEILLTQHIKFITFKLYTLKILALQIFPLKKIILISLP